MTNQVATRDEREAQARAVIDGVAQGMLLMDACERHGITAQSFGRVLSRLRNLAEDYALAQTIAADLMVDETIRLADGNGDPKKVRNQVHARQWAASKRAPKTYGDRLDIAVTQTISVADALTDARARLLRPVSDQQMVEDAQVVDSQAPMLPEPRDEASQEQGEPDIFS